MTILPKKKLQEGKKNDADFDEGRNNSRTRVRTNRERSRPTSNELSSSVDCSGTTSLTTTSSRYEYSELEKRDSPDCSSVPYKRTRHRPIGPGSGRPNMTANEAGRGEITRRHGDPDGTEEGGYNSSDEHGPYEADPDIAKKEEDFETELKERRGFIIKKMVPDGACMFRAVADQVYGDQEMHSIVRAHCMDYMVKNSDYFSKFVTEDFNSYIHRKKNDYCHGNNVEMQALSEMYNRPIEVYVYSTETETMGVLGVFDEVTTGILFETKNCCNSENNQDPMNTFVCQSHINPEENPPMRLSYHGNVHYNSIVDPYAPTVGVGLGIAGYKPGLADRRLLNSVIIKSEEQLLEEAMLRDKLKATDWETTDETMTEVVARESYLQWLKENQRKHRSPPGSTASSSASSSQSKRSPPHEQPSPRPCASGYSPRSPHSFKPNSPHQHSPGTSAKQTDDIGTSQNIGSRRSPPRNQEAGGCDGAAGWNYSNTGSRDFNAWNDDQIIAAVLARSQEEYYQQLSGSHRNMEN